MNNKTATIITLIICIGISFVGYLISLVVFPLAASLIDWSPLFLSLILGIASFLLIWICTFVITKKKGIRTAILLPLLVSIIGGIATSGARFHTREYNHSYLSDWNLYNSMGFKIIDGIHDSDYGYGGNYHLATSPYGNVIVQFMYKRDDEIDPIGDEDDEEYIWKGKARIYTLNGGYLEEKTCREWIPENEYDEQKILLEDLKESYDIDRYAHI